MAVAVEDITELSGQDALTGGYNRQGFVQKAEHILQNANEDENYAILFFNITNFLELILVILFCVSCMKI